MHLLFYKLKQKKNLKDKIFYGFYFKTQKWPFWGQPIFFPNFFLVLAFKTIDTQMLLWSVFLNMHKKTLLTPKQPKWRFWQSINFVCTFLKIPTKRTFVRLLFLKLNQNRNTKNIFLRGFSSKTKNVIFQGSKMVLFKSQST